MAVINVEVPESVALKINTKETITIEELYKIDDSNWQTVVDFWKKWLWKKEFLSYLSI